MTDVREYWRKKQARYRANLRELDPERYARLNREQRRRYRARKRGTLPAYKASQSGASLALAPSGTHACVWTPIRENGVLTGEKICFQCAREAYSAAEK